MEVTATVQRADEKTAKPIPAMLDYWPGNRDLLTGSDATATCQGYRWHAGHVEQPSLILVVIDGGAASPGWVQHDPSAHLMSPWQGSAGTLSVGSDFGPLLPHVGSSSLIVDRRSIGRTPRIAIARLAADGLEMLPVDDQLKEIGASLSVNKSQLARILRVTRPTLYEWYQGKEPNATNSERIRKLLRLLERAAVYGANPLNARFVRRPIGVDEPSILDLLDRDPLDEKRVVHALERARALGVAASRSRVAREDWLRSLGFEDPGSEQRREQLALNVALQDWPER